MDDETRYLSVADVIAIHIAMMERLGATPEALRDEGLLESAVLKPRMAAFYEGADLIRQAALLAIGISRNQPFVDGNKRTAYMAAWLFLEHNGRLFAGDALELARRLERVAERTVSLAESTDRFEQWLREHVK